MRVFRKTVNLLALSGCVFSVMLPAVNAGGFDKGSLTANIAIGSGRFYNEDYLIIGAGAGYYLVDGVEAGLDVDYWSGGDPTIYEVTPKLTYVYDNPSHVKPYIGAFYNRTFIDGFDDSNALGYRAGMYLPQGNVLIGVGIVYTELQDCTETIFNDCSDSYTELSIIFSL